jgi:hypothetical protein
VPVEIGGRSPEDLENLGTEMEGLRVLRTVLNVVDSHLTPGLASQAFRAELVALTRRIEAKEREVLQAVITVPLLNHASMDVVAALRVLSENGLSVAPGDLSASLLWMRRAEKSIDTGNPD